MKKVVLLYLERIYPYLLASTLCILLYLTDFNFLDDHRVDNMIDGLITMESIVIGLIGAIIPVILSMKNDSKFVKYVFENDSRGLFRKYLTVTIGIGLVSVAFSLAMYIRDAYTDKIKNVIYNCWIFFIFLFFLLTYRSMRYMILIIFSPDPIDEPDLSITQEEKDKLHVKHNNIM